MPYLTNWSFVQTANFLMEELWTFDELLYRHEIEIIILAYGLINTASANFNCVCSLKGGTFYQVINMSPQHLHELLSPCGWSNFECPAIQINNAAT